VSATEVELPKGRLGLLIKKELFSFFVSPVSYVIFFLYYLVRAIEANGLVAVHSMRGDADVFVGQYLGTMSTYFAAIMIPPILTMRSFAEEKRTGSLELLLTAPFHDHEVVLGKFFAAWIFYTILWLPSLVILVLIQLPMFSDTSFHFGYVLTSYVGVFALGSLLLAVGVFTSSLTDNQLLASLASMLFGMGLLEVPNILSRKIAGYGSVSVDAGFLDVLLEQTFVSQHLSGWFFRGLMDTGHLVFYLSTAALFLFLTVRVVEARKWR
jgi:ABC-2 type transport system permease protein